MLKKLKFIKDVLKFYNSGVDDDVTTRLTQLPHDLTKITAWKHAVCRSTIHTYLRSIIADDIEGDETSITFITRFKYDDDEYKILTSFEMYPLAPLDETFSSADDARFKYMIHRFKRDPDATTLHLLIKNVNIKSITHVGTDFVLLENLPIFKSLSFSGKMRNASMDLEKYLSAYNHLNTDGDVNTMVQYFGNYLGNHIDVKDTQSSEINIAAVICIQLMNLPCIQMHGISFSGSTWKYFHNYTLDRNYDSIKQLPPEYLTEPLILADLTMGIDSNTKRKVENLIKLNGWDQ